MGQSQSRRTRLIVITIFAAWIAHDLLVPPRYAFDARATLAAIDEYRALVSPHLHGIIQCRFEPTCSWYGHESIRKHGLLVGGVLGNSPAGAQHAWTKLGTVDLP